ncbi:MAG: HPr-rel-A system PqqD family peptide chaperone [Rubrivivax sp.]
MAGGAAPDRFAVRRWDDGIAVFDRRSGGTHCMNTATAAVFERLATDPTASDDAILPGVSACMPGATDAECRAAIAEARVRFDAARLFQA